MDAGAHPSWRGRLVASWRRMGERLQRVDALGLSAVNPNCAARAREYRAAHLPGVGTHLGPS